MDSPPESPLITYRLTWCVDADFIDHLVVAHDFIEARSISFDSMRLEVGHRFDRAQLMTVERHI